MLYEWKEEPYALVRFQDPTGVGVGKWWEIYTLTRRGGELFHRFIDEAEADTLLVFESVPEIPIEYDAHNGYPKTIRLCDLENEDDGGLCIVKMPLKRIW